VVLFILNFSFKQLFTSHYKAEVLRFLLSVLSIHVTALGRLGAGCQDARRAKASLGAGLPDLGLLLASAWLVSWAAGEAVPAAAPQPPAPLMEESKPSPLLMPDTGPMQNALHGSTAVQHFCPS